MRSPKAVTPAPEQMCKIKRENIRLISLDAMTTLKLEMGFIKMEALKRSLIFSIVALPEGMWPIE